MRLREHSLAHRGRQRCQDREVGPDAPVLLGVRIALCRTLPAPIGALYLFLGQFLDPADCFVFGELGFRLGLASEAESGDHLRAYAGGFLSLALRGRPSQGKKQE